MQRWRWVIIGAVGLGALVYFLWPSSYCRSAKRKYGIEVPQCPDGEVRQVLRIRGSGLRRGGKGWVRLWATALYTPAMADNALRARIPKLEAELFLVDPNGKERPLLPPQSALKPRERWRYGRGYASSPVTLPAKLDDGEYLLRAKVETLVGKKTIDLPLPLFSPARIHVLTDRPLYEPGHRIQFRALVVRARDLSPLDNRPGTWLVKDPAGNVLLEEKAPAGSWGVVAGDFLLDGQAPEGNWTVSWRSGNNEGSTQVKVEPFTLPRFRVSAVPTQPFYQIGASPEVKGSVVYSSGAPVQNAKVEIDWSVQGSWPPPAQWTRGGLPKTASTDATGRFTLKLPQVPKDLQGRVTLLARLTATDPAGDRVDGGCSVLLSEDAIQVQALTARDDGTATTRSRIGANYQVAGGLAAGFNNRVYLRVTTADGRPLPGSTILVKRAWQQDAPGIEATLDVDSVTRVQLDPGAPVNVVIPPRPFRKQTRRIAAVRRTRSHDLVADRQASLDDQVRMDRWIERVKPCAKWADGSTAGKVALAVSKAGTISSGTAYDELGRCIFARIKGQKLSAGSDRLYGVTFVFAEPALPKLGMSIDQAVGDSPDGLEELFALAARDARDCLPRRGRGALPWVLSWRLEANSKKLTTSWLKRPGIRANRFSPRMKDCILSAVKRRSLKQKADRNALGVVRYDLSQHRKASQRRPQPTIMKGYELLVSASAAGESLGQTKLRMRPGSIPPLTLRVDPVLAQAGSRITLKLLRGPSFRGSLPRGFTVTHLGNGKYFKIPKGSKTGSYAIPKGKKGWFTFRAGGQRALVFVRSENTLAVAVKSDQAQYAPGTRAKLLIQTRQGGRGARAAVGLFGVDASLEQLTKLPAADALRVLQPKVAMRTPAFGMLQGQAVAQGRVRGTFAAEATVLKVASIPRPPDLDVVLNGSATTPFDAIAPLTDRFYVVLAELHLLTRKWEREAPKGELMKPATMAKLWQKALDSCEARGQKIRDAFGRRLRLHRLPHDLLALTNPRQVVTVGTRLPEDVENWRRWIARRRP